MKSVCQLNQNDSDVLCHSQKHFSQIFRLHLQLILRFISGIIHLQILQLGYTIYQKSHIIAKLFPDFLIGHNGIFDHIM